MVSNHSDKKFHANSKEAHHSFLSSIPVEMLQFEVEIMLNLYDFAPKRVSSKWTVECRMLFWVGMKKHNLWYSTQNSLILNVLPKFFDYFIKKTLTEHIPDRQSYYIILPPSGIRDQVKKRPLYYIPFTILHKRISDPMGGEIIQ